MMENTRRLVEIMARLRHPEVGCPWDLQQDFASLIPYTLEEAYEVADAIERADFADLRDELGDLLLQVAFHARIAEEQSLFAFEDIAAAICEKLIRRHPHVFADAVFENDAERQQHWENSKLSEHREKTGNPRVSALDGVAASLPALMQAQKLQKCAARHGFDWSDVAPVFQKVEEELEETRAALAEANPVHIEEEIGDLLFAVVNLARHLGVDAEAALRGSNRKFSRRFRHIEEQMHGDGRRMADMAADELEAMWEAAKKATRG